jgi:hypothetical protein
VRSARVGLASSSCSNIILTCPEGPSRHRFRARLDVLTSLGTFDRSLSVHLWARLPTPDERGHREPICVDALIETNTAVYGVMMFAGSDLRSCDSTLRRPDAILRVIDAVSWYAGARDCYIATHCTRLPGYSNRQRTDRTLSRL